MRPVVAALAVTMLACAGPTVSVTCVCREQICDAKKKIDILDPGVNPADKPADLSDLGFEPSGKPASPR